VIVDRRSFLFGLGCVGATALAGPRLALASAETDRRLVVLILRGAMDGLAAVPAHGDPSYAQARGDAATGDVLDLDGTFGLHPSLSALRPLWDRQELAVVHAAAAPYAERSHFDGQNVLENGTATPFGAQSGWLNRGISTLSDGPPAMAVGRAVPLVLRGPARSTSADPTRPPRVDDALLARIRDLYRSDELLGGTLEEGLATERILASFREPGARGRDDVDGALVLGRAMASDQGPRVAVLELGGFDTHTAQERMLASRLEVLGATIDGLSRGLGAEWSRTVVVAVTEFGRTVRANGTGGTDHGVGGAAILAGGALAGGRVIADWPGLRASDLLEERDLRATTDLRSVFKGILRDHLGVPEGALEREVFPDSAGAPLLEGLVHA
jgi:uncharacterized protein (DUF1501 family)